jgi:IS30 family transposase
LEKHLYNAAFAQKEYVAVLSESRSGIALPPADLQRIDAMLSPLIKRGQSLNHVYASHADALMVSEKSIYHYMDMGLFSAKSLDLPRKVRFRPRKSHHSSFKVEPACRKNRSFSDYCSFMRQHPDVPVVQLDSVEGRKGGKVLLTIHFVSSECMLAFLRDYNDAASVTYIFNSLYEDLGAAVFRRLFPVCLTDNGSEFSNPTAIELDNQHQQRTRIFYCDPSAPYQKGSAENNHALIRRVLPKGHPLDALTQEDINRVMSHVNAVKRLKLGNHSPYEVFTPSYFSRKTRSGALTAVSCKISLVSYAGIPLRQLHRLRLFADRNKFYKKNLFFYLRYCMP